MNNRLLFLTLNVFSATGGIEKVCRVAGKALHELSVEKGSGLSVFSMYDNSGQVDETYFPRTLFKGFGGNRLKFVLASVRAGRGCNVVLLSHLNLLPVGYLIKKISPKTKLFLIAHGIEVWQPLSRLKRTLLQSVDLFLPVSSFTGKKLTEIHGTAARKVRVLNNCLDPFLKKNASPALEKALRERYNIGDKDLVLLTVTRLSFSEQYKGYDKVVAAMAEHTPSTRRIRYLIVGKYDAEEKDRLDAIISRYGLQDAVIYAGFAKDEELSAHFNLADAYIMPSTGEGFGIVFIEALFYGLPVIAGNVDGSVDALAGGEFGILVDPNNNTEIAEAVKKIVANKQSFVPDEKEVVKKFGYQQYKRKLEALLPG